MIGSIKTSVVIARTPGVIIEPLVAITETTVATMANTMIVIIEALVVMHYVVATDRTPIVIIQLCGRDSENSGRDH